MKLSKTTVDLLKNFAAINPNILFKPGQSIQTVSEAKNIMASANIGETIPQQFGIYDLNEFLAAVDLIENSVLVFNEKTIDIQGSDTSVRYFCSDSHVLTVPPRQVVMPAAEVSFRLTQEQIEKVKRAAGVLGHSTLEISGDNGVIDLNVIDPKNGTSNTFSYNLAKDNPCKERFSFILSIANLKMIPGTYDVSISSKLIAHFKISTADIQYWIALEKSSYFGSKQS